MLYARLQRLPVVVPLPPDARSRHETLFRRVATSMFPVVSQLM